MLLSFSATVLKHAEPARPATVRAYIQPGDEKRETSKSHSSLAPITL